MAAHRIGVDIVPVGRIRRSLESFGDAFRKRLLTPGESEYCRRGREPERVAGRVAAKEAVMKVLGLGWPAIPWTSIEVLPDESGRPAVHLTGKAAEAMSRLGIMAIDVSITHDCDVAIAAAIGTGLVRGDKL
ncbi:MAG: holo-ACP synthase [Firmicutes bacterium]|jgi:holo-[acyl-carrier protein] synthase|nr:holo-ACP synthase [Candidatus Fermentithermobacillaceae bacterium]